jgi:hypothetical protein
LHWHLSISLEYIVDKCLLFCNNRVVLSLN